MTNEQIIADERDQHLAFEKTTVGAYIGGQPVMIADLRRTFDAVCNTADWKAPFAAFVPHQIVPLVIEAVKYFHADVPSIGGIQPLTGKILVEGRGYQA
jgi:hypothetical protein